MFSRSLNLVFLQTGIYTLNTSQLLGDFEITVSYKSNWCQAFPNEEICMF